MSDYIPRRGDIVWLDFDPVRGNEQKGHRPAIIISVKSYNQFGLCFAAPISNTKRNWPSEVELESDADTSGVIMLHQLRTVDWRARDARFKEQVTMDTLEKVDEILHLIMFSS